MSHDSSAGSWLLANCQLQGDCLQRPSLLYAVPARYFVVLLSLASLSHALHPKFMSNCVLLVCWSCLFPEPTTFVTADSATTGLRSVSHGSSVPHMICFEFNHHHLCHSISTSKIAGSKHMLHYSALCIDGGRSGEFSSCLMLIQGPELSSSEDTGAHNARPVEWKSTADSAPDHKTASLSKESIVPQRSQAVHDQPTLDDAHHKGGSS